MTEMAAIYCRVSLKAGSGSESASILTQRAMLGQYCRENGLKVAGVYADDGWSGTNYQRPGFSRMLADVESGLIDTVVVKDLSRFGRETTGLRENLEYLKQKGVRFISLADGTDTRTGWDFSALTMAGAINSLYVVELSEKTRNARKAMARSGMYMGSHAPYGYMKDPLDNHHLIPDRFSADIVRLIYSSYAGGMSIRDIAAALIHGRIYNPKAYYEHISGLPRSDKIHPEYQWFPGTIYDILINQVYLGCVVYGKSEVKLVYDSARVYVPRENWIVVEDTHEALVAREQWTAVQTRLHSRNLKKNMAKIPRPTPSKARQDKVTELKRLIRGTEIA